MPKAKSQKSLDRWSKQKWRTASGKKSSKTGEVYAPAKTIAKLKSTAAGRKKLAAANAKKKEATKKGKQHAKHGLHKGKMPALLQLGSRITVFRDGDKDDKSEEIGVPVKGWFGINFHLNTYDFQSKVKKQFINDWSAGCQVCDVTVEYLRLIALVHERNELVSYCLLKEF